MKNRTTSISIPIPSLSEIVLKNGNFDHLKDWYVKALAIEPYLYPPSSEESVVEMSSTNCIF